MRSNVRGVLSVVVLALPIPALAQTALEATPGRIAPTLHELSPWSMFLGADNVVKAVMIGLALASVITWTVCFAKLIEMMLARQKLQAGLKRMAESRTLAEAQVRVARELADGRAARSAALGRVGQRYRNQGARGVRIR